MKADRETLLLGVLVVALLGVAAWAWNGLDDAADDAQAAVADAAESRRLAEAITSRGLTPEAPQVDPGLNLIARVERAAAEVGWDDGAVEQVGTEQQRRVDRETVERTRTLYLRGVTLPDLVAFLQALARDDPGLRVRSIELVAPPDAADDGPELWNPQVELARTLREAPAEGR